ncbi:hypothetical protein IO99_13790 [Clostridium sulfidigenes]|uniref:DUF4145 domain-containing protein n=1 Tax=Clostridium sulfidigenes TaxID=318464 RepID=A0A084J9C8_9CLOT|nr:DUF4145 domain-containing protein [Clostridium sulfidigenes]KEZ85562.1 hypothetical protein IO99_13790 [Clostridium sulfidigenes]
MIDSLSGFLDVIERSNCFKKERFESNIKITTLGFEECIDELFCPKCGDIRRCVVNRVTHNPEFEINEFTESIVVKSLPCLFKATCLQCESETLLLIYKGPEEVELAVLHDTYNGCVTPNSPKEVKYYIDQAYRARSVGAVSASMAMYRSALEWLLYDQGFEKGMLGNKIKTLEEKIEKNNEPKWAVELDIGFLKAIKEIGNGSMHTNGGDIEKQNNIDKNLLELVDIVFAELLDKIYEQPLRSSNNLSKLKEKALAMSK